MPQPELPSSQEDLQEGSFVQPVSSGGQCLFRLIFLGYLSNSEEWQDIHRALGDFFYHERWGLFFWESYFEITSRCSNSGQKKRKKKQAKLWIGILSFQFSLGDRCFFIQHQSQKTELIATASSVWDHHYNFALALAAQRQYYLVAQVRFIAITKIVMSLTHKSTGNLTLL